MRPPAARGAGQPGQLAAPARVKRDRLGPGVGLRATGCGRPGPHRVDGGRRRAHHGKLHRREDMHLTVRQRRGGAGGAEALRRRREGRIPAVFLPCHRDGEGGPPSCAQPGVRGCVSGWQRPVPPAVSGSRVARAMAKRRAIASFTLVLTAAASARPGAPAMGDGYTVTLLLSPARHSDGTGRQLSDLPRRS